MLALDEYNLTQIKIDNNNNKLSFAVSTVHNYLFSKFQQN